MKKIISIITIVFLILFIVSCEKDEDFILLIDVSGLTYNEALIRINADYIVEMKEVPTNREYPNIVIGYENSSYRVGTTPVLLVAVPPLGSQSVNTEMFEYTFDLGFLTGPNSINFDILRESGVGGCDLGFPIALSGNEYMLVFGDTFSSVGSHGGFWNSNYMAISSDTDFTDGLTIDRLVTYPMGMIKPFAQGKHSQDISDTLSSDMEREVTKIPTGGITIGNNVYIFYMSIRTWDNWRVTYNQCVKASLDDLTNFVDVPSLRWYDHEAFNFGQIFPVKDPASEYIYLYSIPGGRNGGVVLSRVRVDDFEDRTKYEYYTSTGFVEGDAGLLMLKTNPRYIVGPSVSEICIYFNPYLNKWMLSYASGGRLGFRLSDTPVGPFGAYISIGNYPFYAALSGSPLFMDNGRKMYMITSQWLPIYQSKIIEIVFK